MLSAIQGSCKATLFDGKIKIQGKSEDVAKDPVAKEFYLGKDFTL